MLKPFDFEFELLEHRDALFSYAVSLSRNGTTAEDMVQDVMVRALTRRDQFEVGTNLTAWLFTIMKNSFFSSYRKNRRMVEDPDDALAKSIPVHDDPVRRIEAKEMLEMIGKLGPQLQAPLLMLAEGATYDEISVELMHHLGTVKSRIARGRRMLLGIDYDGTW